MNRFLAIVAAAGLSACTYSAESSAPPQPAPPIMAYAAKVPGKWALLVDTEKADLQPEAEGPRCSQFDYQADPSASFARIVAATFAQVADDARLEDHQMSRAELASGRFTGVIIVRVSDLHAHVKVDDLIGGEAAASASIEGTILVVSGDQRLVDSRQSAKGEDSREAGLACDGAATALAGASDAAMQDLARKLAEQFGNSHAVRYPSTQGLTP